MMTAERSPQKPLHAWLLLPALFSSVVGCRHSGLWNEHCADFAPGAIPAPAGTYNGQWQQEQGARADRDYFVIYQYEWLGESDQLSPFGARHFERVLQRAPHMPSPIVVEPSGDAELDQLRVAVLRTALDRPDATWGDWPVIVGHSETEPLYGFEAPRVLRGFIGGVGGGQGGGQGGGRGGFGGGSAGMGGGGPF